MSAGPNFGTLLASSAATATRTSDPVKSYGAKSAIFYVDFTATPNNTETFTFSIEGQDPVSGKWLAFTAFTALTSSSLGANPTAQTYAYTLGVAAAETAAVSNHESQALTLPQIFRVKGTQSSTGSWTYSVGFYTFE